MLEPGRLSVNASATGGELRVSVADAAGKPVAGYEASDCLPITGDSVSSVVGWKDRDQLPELESLRLRFHLRDAQLYSYQVLPPAE